MPPLEAWARVLIDAETYSEDVHSYINCTACHGGENVYDMEAAHDGLITNPTDDPQASCESCHPDIVPDAMNSLHATLEGYDLALHARSSEMNWDTLEYMQSYHCNDCHATCGDCHVSQPRSVGGGLLEGHSFVGTPPMSNTCTACHGSRVKNEYYGLNEGIPCDVHLRQARMACTDCHTGDEMHGSGEYGEANHRYEGPAEPSCESCHEDQVGVGSGIPQHEIHGTEILECQVCHSVAYTNCVNCHVDRTEDDIPFYSVEEHSTGFYIGKNSLQSGDRPYRYVTVRHVPADPDQFEEYGENLLDEFLNRPTWLYATPHNIQRITPQNETCESCHGNDDVFLTPDKVAPAELDANRGVMVEHAPALPENWEQYLNGTAIEGAAPAPAQESAPVTDGDAGFWGEPAPTEEASDDAGFWGEPAPTEEASDDAGFWGEPAPTEDAAPDAQEEVSDADFWG